MKHLARIPLAQLPTPVRNLSRLSDLLEGPDLWVKRDDQTGLAFGGNKTRKLEYLAAEAVETGAEMLITAGAPQSNHCRQTAAAAASLGMKCRLILAGDKPDNPSANFLLDRLLGAELVWTSKDSRDERLVQVFEEATKEGEHPYLVPYGGSNPLGAAAYAYALKELLDQGLHPDWIVFASSSGGTQAGLVAGAQALGFQGQLLGISVDEAEDVLSERVLQLAKETAALIGAEGEISEDAVRVNDDYLGEGYAIMGLGDIEAIQIFAQNEGLLLDPVYTGRAAAGLITLIRDGFFSKEDTVLFWHTGGGPALFADAFRADFSKFINQLSD